MLRLFAPFCALCILLSSCGEDATDNDSDSTQNEQVEPGDDDSNGSTEGSDPDDDGSVTDPDDDGTTTQPDDDGTTTQPDDSTTTPSDPPADESSMVYLEADGVTETYSLLNSYGFYEEVPDCGHDVPHIVQEWDEELGKYVFAMSLHVEEVIDTDRCKDSMNDRQRNEIKVYSESPATMYGTYGETHTYTWKFRLAETHTPSTEFTHIHQIKSVGGYESEPMIAFTTRDSSPDHLEVVYRAPEEDYTKTYITKINLDEVLGDWISCTETITCVEGGDYALKLERVSDGEVLLDYANNFDFWGEGTELVRIKYGMYRKVYTDKVSGIQIEGLIDETIKLSDLGVLEH